LKGATDYRRDGTSQHCEKKLRNDSESGSRGNLCLLKKQNIPKAQQKLLKSRRILNIKMSAKRDPDFTFSLPGEAAHPCPTSVTPVLFHVRCCT